MCEHDEGWHLADSVAPLSAATSLRQSTLESSYSAYLARVMSIVKSGSLASEMKIMFSESGRNLLAEIEKRAVAQSQTASETNNELAESYLAVRGFFAAELEANRVFSLVANPKELNRPELEMCELRNGKTVWLCPKHVEKTNATVIRDSARAVNATQNNTVYNKMLEFIALEDTALL